MLVRAYLIYLKGVKMKKLSDETKISIIFPLEKEFLKDILKMGIAFDIEQVKINNTTITSFVVSRTIDNKLEYKKFSLLTTNGVTNIDFVEEDFRNIKVWREH